MIRKEVPGRAVNFGVNFLPKKLSISSQKYGCRIRDPRSGIRIKPIPDPGPRVKKAPDPGSGSATMFLVRKEVPGRAVRVPVGDHPRPHLRPHLCHLRPARQHAHRCQGTRSPLLFQQCCGSVTFWYGSGSADPCLLLLDPDPAIFVIVRQNAKKNNLFSKFLQNTIFKVHLHHFS